MFDGRIISEEELVVGVRAQMRFTFGRGRQNSSGSRPAMIGQAKAAPKSLAGHTTPRHQALTFLSTLESVVTQVTGILLSLITSATSSDKMTG